MKMRILFLVLLASVVWSADLAGINLGTPIYGPVVAPADLEGRVVVFEYWGVNCPPCVANIPHVSELAAQAGREQLVVIANHCQGPGRTKQVWTEKGGTEAVSVIEGGDLAGAQVSGIPRVFVFDHRGTQVFDGHPAALTASMMAPWIAAVPGPLLPKGDFPTCAKEAKTLGTPNAPVGSALKALRAKVAAAKEPAATEASTLLAGVAAITAQRLETIKAERTANPLAAQRTVTRFVTVLKGDELAKPFEALAEEFKADKALQAEIKAADVLDQLRTAGRKLGAGGKDLPNSKKNQVNELAKQLVTLQRKYPDTKAGAEALTLAGEWTGTVLVPPVAR